MTWHLKLSYPIDSDIPRDTGTTVTHANHYMDWRVSYRHVQLLSWWKVLGCPAPTCPALGSTRHRVIGYKHVRGRYSDNSDEIQTKCMPIFNAVCRHKLCKLNLEYGRYTLVVAQYTTIVNTYHIIGYSDLCLFQ
jgi:hypothetical protein